MNLLMCLLVATSPMEKAEQDIRTVFPEHTSYKRYLYLYNVGEKEKEDYLAIVSFILNSVSDKKKITLPEFVDEEKTVIKFDIRNYGLNAKSYESLGCDPYTKQSDKLKLYTNASNPLIRADWFIAKAMLAPTYYKLLGVNDLKSFRKRFNHDPEQSEKLRADQAAVVVSSGLAKNSRLIRRSATLTGAIWESRESATTNYFTDFLSNKYDSIELLAFNQNGLISYFAADSNGKAYNHLSADIAVDNSESFKSDRIVYVARNCVACHVHGVVPVDDNVRKLIKKDIGLIAPDKDTKDKIADLFSSDLPVGRDQNIYEEALVKATGMASKTFTHKFVALQNAYYNDVTLEQAAKELGKTIGDFKKECLQSGNARLVALTVLGKLPRIHFEEALKGK